MILIKRVNEQIDISKVAEEDLMKMDKTFTQIKMLTMTDMEHKPNGCNLLVNQMTEEEWNDYFECRKKYDKKLSIDEIKKIVKNAMHFIDSDHDKFMEESLKVPVPPNLAISYKAFNGLKAMKKFNLSLAKETYPDEF